MRSFKIVHKYAIGDIIISDETDALRWIYNITKTDYHYLYKLKLDSSFPFSNIENMTSMYTDIFRELKHE